MKKEVIKILNRRVFYFVLLMMFLAVFSDFFYECYMFRGAKLSEVISAYNGSILSSTVSTPFGVVFSLFLPVCVSAVASTIAQEEKKMGLDSCIYTRTSRKKYIFQQAAAVFCISFIMVCLCLFTSLLLSLITFPIQGYNTMFLSDYDRLLLVDPNYLFGYIYRLHPYVNIVLFIILRGLFAGAFAWFAYGISFWGKGNRVLTILSPFILVILMQPVMRIVKEKVTDESIQYWFNTNILAINHYGKEEALFVIWGIFILLGLCGIVRGVRSEALS